ncbi:hypothetical protein CR513_60946, partial [Mucuna pruriens]
MITFSERDMRYEPPRKDEPMVISVVTSREGHNRPGELDQHPILVDLQKTGIAIGRLGDMLRETIWLCRRIGNDQRGSRAGDHVQRT